MIAWPKCELYPNSATIDEMFANEKGYTSLSGSSQVAASDAGGWKLVLEGIPLYTTEKIKLWRAIRSQSQGMIGQFIVPVFEQAMAPLPKGQATGILHSDGTKFSDGTAYTQGHYIAELSDDVEESAVQFGIKFYAQNSPEPGQGFEVGFGRFYKISSIVSQSSSVVTVRIWPPFRAKELKGTSCNFHDPKLFCRLYSDEEMILEPLIQRRRSTGNVTFIEDNRPIE